MYSSSFSPPSSPAIWIAPTLLDSLSTSPVVITFVSCGFESWITRSATAMWSATTKVESRSNRPVLERRGHGDRFEGGARLVRVRDDPVTLLVGGRFVEMVVVVPGGVRERHDGAVVGPHHQADGPPCLVRLHGGLEGLLQLPLHRGVQGKGDVIATLEAIVVAGLHAAEGVAVVADVPDDLAGEGLLGVHPDRIGLYRDAREIERGDLLGRLR